MRFYFGYINARWKVLLAAQSSRCWSDGIARDVEGYLGGGSVMILAVRIVPVGVKEHGVLRLAQYGKQECMQERGLVRPWASKGSERTPDGISIGGLYKRGSVKWAAIWDA